MNDATGWHLPYREQDPAPLTLDDGTTIVAGGIVAMGAVTLTPLGRFPILILRFSTSDNRPGAPMPTVALLLDDDALRRVPVLVEAAVQSAIRKAAGR